MKAAAIAHCVAWRTIERAKAKIGVRSSREGFGKKGVWKWELADPVHTPPNNAIERQQDCLADNGENGGLCEKSHDSEILMGQASTAVLVDGGALAADRARICYLDAWARLQVQPPLLLAESDWRRAIDDAGRFLDTWGADAAAMQWSMAELFDAPREGRPGGLIWRLNGERVEALGADCARLSDGRMIDFQPINAGRAKGQKMRDVTPSKSCSPAAERMRRHRQRRREGLRHFGIDLRETEIDALFDLASRLLSCGRIGKPF
jgi:hypothetical protein